MSPNALELALKKQRLQIAGEGLRADFGRCASGLMPAFVAADMAVASVSWIRRNPELVVATGVALIVMRPKSAWRWARRAFVGWRIWQNFRETLENRLPHTRPQ